MTNLENMGYCGINCGTCPAHIAFINDDDELRKKTAENWTKLYNTSLKPDMINCVGCKKEGKKIAYCDSLCEIKKCCETKNYENCSKCPDYSCDKVNFVHSNNEEAKNNIDALL